MIDISASKLSGAYELTWDEIDLVSGGTPEDAYNYAVAVKNYANDGMAAAAVLMVIPGFQEFAGVVGAVSGTSYLMADAYIWWYENIYQ